jgi:hypothetical protein
MLRAISVVAASVILWTCTSADDAGAPNPPSEDEFYAAFFEEVLERSLQWLGSIPAPGSYCVAIAPRADEVWASPGAAPGPPLLERLNASPDGITFHSILDCVQGDRPGSPTGDPAGVLWVSPLNPREPGRLFGGWFGFREATEWGCTLRESEGSVVIERCDLWAET